MDAPGQASEANLDNQGSSLCHLPGKAIPPTLHCMVPCTSASYACAGASLAGPETHGTKMPIAAAGHSRRQLHGGDVQPGPPRADEHSPGTGASGAG